MGLEVGGGSIAFDRLCLCLSVVVDVSPCNAFVVTVIVHLLPLSDEVDNDFVGVFLQQVLEL